MVPPITLSEYAPNALRILFLEKLPWPPSCIILKPIAAKVNPSKQHKRTEIQGLGVKKTSVVYIPTNEVIKNKLFKNNLLPPETHKLLEMK
jgi:hypothetical protein